MASVHSKAAIATLCVCISLISEVTLGASTERVHYERCPMYYYFDHGTEHCEHCRDICDHANITDTLQQCLDHCKPYAEILWPEKPQDNLPKPKPSTPDNKDNSSVPETAIWITLSAVVVIVLSALAVVLIKRKSIFDVFKRTSRRRRDPPAQTAIVMNRLLSTEPAPPHTQGPLGQTATVVGPLQPASPATQPTASESSQAGSLAASTSGSSGRTAGIQETERANPHGAGNHRYQILPTAEQPSESSAEPSAERELKSPVPVTDDGRRGDFEMALPNGSRATSDPWSSHFGPQSRSPYHRDQSLPDLDSTEPKTASLMTEPEVEGLLGGTSDGETGRVHTDSN